MTKKCHAPTIPWDIIMGDTKSIHTAPPPENWLCLKMGQPIFIFMVCQCLPTVYQCLSSFFHLKSLPILDTLQKNQILCWLVDIPLHTKRLVRISLYPCKIIPLEMVESWPFVDHVNRDGVTGVTGLGPLGIQQLGAILHPQHRVQLPWAVEHFGIEHIPWGLGDIMGGYILCIYIYTYICGMVKGGRMEYMYLIMYLDIHIYIYGLVKLHGISYGHTSHANPFMSSVKMCQQWMIIPCWVWVCLGHGADPTGTLQRYDRYEISLKHSTRPIGWSTRVEFHVQHTLKIEKYLRNSRNKKPKNFPSEGHFRSESSGQNHPQNGPFLVSLCARTLDCWLIAARYPAKQ